MDKTIKTSPGFIVIEESRLSAPQSYADGVTGVLLGVPVSKIHFHNAVAMDEKTGQEIRRITLALCLPTSTLIEFCRNTLKGFESNVAAIGDAFDEYKSKTLSVVSTEAVATSESPAKARRTRTTKTSVGTTSPIAKKNPARRLRGK